MWVKLTLIEAEALLAELRAGGREDMADALERRIAWTKNEPRMELGGWAGTDGVSGGTYRPGEAPYFDI